MHTYRKESVGWSVGYWAEGTWCPLRRYTSALAAMFAVSFLNGGEYNPAVAENSRLNQ